MSTPPEGNPLATYDLHAWEAPAPAPGIADAVVARMKAPARTARASSSPSRTLIAAALVAALVAVAAVTVVAITHGDTRPVEATAPAPAHEPRVLAAGGGSTSPDDARTQRLEAQLSQLEARVAVLEAAATRTIVHHVPATRDDDLDNPYTHAHGSPRRPAPVAPAPHPAHGDGQLKDPFDDRGGGLIDPISGDPLEDPFATRTGGTPTPTPPPAPVPVPVDPNAIGTLHLAAIPICGIAIDGNDTKMKTPMTLNVRVGKHKVTFMIDGNKYTFNVNIRAGETVTLDKDLR